MLEGQDPGSELLDEHDSVAKKTSARVALLACRSTRKFIFFTRFNYCYMALTYFFVRNRTMNNRGRYGVSHQENTDTIEGNLPNSDTEIPYSMCFE